jgi:hypothetical protein
MDTIKAGPDLDALVAEKVMGWKPDPDNFFWLGKGTTNQRVTSSDCFDCGTEFPAWTPSTSIADAWEVMEKICQGKEDTYRFEIVKQGHLYWVSIWDDGFSDGDVGADTAPLAICLAALKAKSVEV